jgi:hypothetical protein
MPRARGMSPPCGDLCGGLPNVPPQCGGGVPEHRLSSVSE